jgi:hypothetical protein
MPLGLRALFKSSAPKRKRAHQPIEIFQKRNREVIKDKLTVEGYDNLETTPDDNEDDWVDESEGTAAARNKSKKSARMRLRTRVVKALWAEASQEEKEAVAAEVEKEKEELREAEVRRENETEAKTPSDYQE